MKKLLLLLFALPLLMFNSCNNDEDLPKVDIEMTLSNVSQVGNTFYAVKGDVVTINGVSVKSLTSKDAAVTNVIYRLSKGAAYAWVVPSSEEPYNYSFSTEDLAEGTYTLVVNATILQVDKSIANGVFGYPIQIVDQLPDGAPAIGTYSVTTSVNAD